MNESPNTPPEPLEAATSETPLWLIWYYDRDVAPELFEDEEIARKYWELRLVGYSCHLFSNEAALERRCATLQRERDEAIEQREGMIKIYEEAEAAYRDKRDMIHHLQREMTKRRAEYELVRDERDTLQREIEALRQSEAAFQEAFKQLTIRTTERDALKADLQSAREKQSHWHRRAQQAEAACVQFKTDWDKHGGPTGGTFGRAVIACGYRAMEDDLESTKADLETVKRHMALARNDAGCPDDDTLVMHCRQLRADLAAALAGREKARAALESAIETAIRENQPQRPWIKKADAALADLSVDGKIDLGGK